MNLHGICTNPIENGCGTQNLNAIDYLCATWSEVELLSSFPIQNFYGDTKHSSQHYFIVHMIIFFQLLFHINYKLRSKHN